MKYRRHIPLVVLTALTLGACSIIEPRSDPRKAEPTDIGIEDPEIDESLVDDEPIPPAEIEIVIEVPELPPEPGISLQDEILLFGHSWLSLSGEARRQELAQAELAWFNDPDDVHLVRYALLTALSRPMQPGATTRIRNALRQWLAEQEQAIGRSELVPLAGILLRLMDDRESLLSEMLAEIEELQGKLDELRAIEQQMRERESTEIIRTLP